jgi:hypothetical protein
VHTWVSKEEYDKLKAFLDKFSTGESFSQQLRQLLVWTGNPKIGVDAAVLAQKLQEVEKKRNAELEQCPRALNL